MIALDHDHGPARLFDQRSIIRGLAAGSMRSAQHRSTESLRCLHGHQCGPVGGGYHRAIGLHDFDRVGHGNTGHCCVSAGCDRSNHTRVYRRRCKGAGCIVHADDCCVVRHGRKTRPDRRRTRIPTRYCTLGNSVTRGHNNHHTVTHLLGNGLGMIDHATVADQLVLLLFAKSLAIATADDNSPNCFNMRHSP